MPAPAWLLFQRVRFYCPSNPNLSHAALVTPGAPRMQFYNALSHARRKRLVRNAFTHSLHSLAQINRCKPSIPAEKCVDKDSCVVVNGRVELKGEPRGVNKGAPAVPSLVCPGRDEYNRMAIQGNERTKCGCNIHGSKVAKLACKSRSGDAASTFGPGSMSPWGCKWNPTSSTCVPVDEPIDGADEVVDTVAEYTDKTRPPKPSHLVCTHGKKIRLRLVNGGASVPVSHI